MSLTQTDKEHFEGFITKAVSLSRDTLDDHWDKKTFTLGDVTTGEDLSTTEGKAKVRKAYEYVKDQMDRSNLVTKTVVVEIVKLAVLAAIVILGMRV